MPIYEWNCKTCDKTLEVLRPVADYMLPPDHPHAVTRVLSLAYAVGDIAPYTAMAGDMAGKPIEGRKEHREFLKRNGLREVGNDPIKPRKPQKIHKKGEVARDIKQAIEQVRANGSR